MGQIKYISISNRLLISSIVGLALIFFVSQWDTIFHPSHDAHGHGHDAHGEHIEGEAGEHHGDHHDEAKGGHH
jgi:hypothetical protein